MGKSEFDQTPHPDITPNPEKKQQVVKKNIEPEISVARSFSHLIKILDTLADQNKTLYKPPQKGKSPEPVTPAKAKEGVIAARDAYVQLCSDLEREKTAYLATSAGGIREMVKILFLDIDYQMSMLKQPKPKMWDIQEALMKLQEHGFEIKVQRKGKQEKREPEKILRTLQSVIDTVQISKESREVKLGRLNSKITAITQVANLNVKVYKILREWIFGEDAYPTQGLPKDEGFTRQYLKYLEILSQPPKPTQQEPTSTDKPEE